MDNRDYQSTIEHKSIERICEHYGLSYANLEQNAADECKENWTEESGIDWEWYYDFHMKRVAAHVRKSYENLIAYTTRP